MKLYAKYQTAISALAFSPDGSKLAIGASYEHDNAVGEAERGTVMLLIKDTVAVDCKVRRIPTAISDPRLTRRVFSPNRKHERCIRS